MSQATFPASHQEELCLVPISNKNPHTQGCFNGKKSQNGVLTANKTTNDSPKTKVGSEPHHFHIFKLNLTDITTTEISELRRNLLKTTVNNTSNPTIHKARYISQRKTYQITSTKMDKNETNKLINKVTINSKLTVHSGKVPHLQSEMLNIYLNKHLSILYKNNKLYEELASPFSKIDSLHPIESHLSAAAPARTLGKCSQSTNYAITMHCSSELRKFLEIQSPPFTTKHSNKSIIKWKKLR